MASPLEDLFPESSRVIYGRAPLSQVICQVRFPPLLRIEAEPPIEFQERVRGLFPYFERVAAVPPDVPPEIAQIVASTLGASSSYRFFSAERSHFVSLEANALSLTTGKYRKWEDFRVQLIAALDALLAVYNPNFFTRIGLRYIDIIDRSKIGLDGVNWSELLNRELIGELSIPIVERNILSIQKAATIRDDETYDAVTIRQALNTPQDSGESQYTIDLDFYRGRRVEKDDANAVIDKLHQLVGRAFRWCIAERLHHALDPHDP